VSVDNVRTLACTHRWSHGCVGCANHSAAPRTCCSQGEAKNKAQRHADAVEMVIPDTGDVCCPAVCPSTPVYMELEILIIPCAHKVCFGALWGALGKRPPMAAGYSGVVAATVVGAFLVCIQLVCPLRVRTLPQQHAHLTQIHQILVCHPAKCAASCSPACPHEPTPSYNTEASTVQLRVCVVSRDEGCRFVRRFGVVVTKSGCA
jgi:hypothetical protein